MKLLIVILQTDNTFVSEPVASGNYNLNSGYLCAMKYQPGDKILVLHSNEEGEVVEIINDKMVLIDVEGYVFLYIWIKLTFPYFKRFSEKEALRKEKG